MKFSYDRAWADIVAMARAHVEILLVLAGVFLLLPDFARAIFVPSPKIESFDWAAIETLNIYFRENGLALFLLGLPTLLGSAAILSMLLDPRKPTVGAALKVALVMLPSLVVLSWLTQFAILGGLFLLIVPGIYLLGRLAVAQAAAMAERQMNPLKAIARSFELTRGNGWRVAGISLLFAIVAAITARAIGAIIGIILSLIVPSAALVQVTALLSATLGAVTLLLMLLLAAAIYRQLVPSNGT